MNHPQVISLDTIKPKLVFSQLIPAISQGFQDYYQGRVHAAPITNIELSDANGEMHIKPGYMVGGDHICVKIATCYYDNPAKGLPTRDGIVVMANRWNGRIEAVLCDSGLITDMRTAASSAAAASVLAPPGEVRLGLIGTGTQARWHALALREVCEISRIYIWGRRPEQLEASVRVVADETGLPVSAASLDDVAGCDVVVTATPANEPVLTEQSLQPGALLIAMGADAVGKRELGPAILGQASTIIVDSIEQCLNVGELQWLKSGVEHQRVVELGAIIANDQIARVQPDDIVVFDSTGVAFQDLVGASEVLEVRGHAETLGVS